jgi:hypothetical protein
MSATQLAETSQRLRAASTSGLCSTLQAYTTGEQLRQMTEAELAVRGVTLCNRKTYGSTTASRFGAVRFNRSTAQTPVAGRDYDCADFSNAARAQRFFLASGGPQVDRYDLDRDGDGLACEWGRQIRRIASTLVPRARVAPRRTSSSRCYVGPRGGTYTLTASGNKNYSGC